MPRRFLRSDADLPLHGPSPYGDYCGTAPACEQERNRRARSWRAPHAPRRRSLPGGYRGIATSRPARVELVWQQKSQPVPIFGEIDHWFDDASPASKRGLLSALARCSMLVIPFDGEAIVQGVECVTALHHALEHPDLPAVLAYDRAAASDFLNHETRGVSAVRVGAGIPRDVDAVVAAVDRVCAAYECLHIAAEA